MTIAENIKKIKSEIGKAQLIAVSKTQTAEKIREAISAGQHIFGENRVQEAAAKFPQLRADFPDLQLHLIGPLQTNKVREALALFDVIQTLDREKLALTVAKEIERMIPTPHLMRGKASASARLGLAPLERQEKEFMIQVNIGKEPQKAGIAPELAGEFFNFCTHELKLNVTGLMCIPPASEPAFMYFALLRNLAKEIEVALRGKAENRALSEESRCAATKRRLSAIKLSMGMSADYKDAAELGADFVRIGSAIFGERA